MSDRNCLPCGHPAVSAAGSIPPRRAPTTGPLLLALGGLAALVFGCAAAEPAESSRSAQPSLAGQVALALAAGEQAAAKGRSDALAAATHFLIASGARPAESGEADLSARWTALAQAKGAPVQPPFRGRALGPAYRRGHLPAGGSFGLQQLFLAGRKAEVALMPVAKASLLLEVADADGQVLCRQGASDPPAKCGWLPVYTARHSVTVRNSGRASADYFIVIN